MATTMRAPLLISFVLVLAVVATVHLVPAACIADGYGPLEKAPAKEPKEQILHVPATPAMTADTYDQKPIEEQAGTATAADEKPDKYVPDEKVKEEAHAEAKEQKSDAYTKKVKKEKKEKSEDDSEKKEKKDKSDSLDESPSSKKEKKVKSDYLDESTSAKKEKKEKSDDSDESSSSKKKKKAKSDDSDEEASSSSSLEKKEKIKEKKEKKEKSTDSDASSSSAYLNKEESSDEATSSLKKEKKEKTKKKKEKSAAGEEKADEDAAPVDVSSDGAYVSPNTKGAEKSDEDASPVDVSSTSGDYVSSSKANKGGERQISTNNADAFPSPKQQQVASSIEPMASPDELPPAATKSSGTADTYASPKQPIAGGAPDELPPAATKSSRSSIEPMSSPDELPPAATKSSGTADAYASPKQPIAGGAPDELPPAATKSRSSSIEPMSSPDELPPQAKQSSATAGAGDQLYAAALNEPAAAEPKLLMGALIKRPIAKILSPMIKSVCAKTEYPEDCEASISGVPGAATAAATDSVGVLRLAMEGVRQKAADAMNAATARMKAPGMDETVRDALGSCASSYSDLKASLDTVDDALRRGDVATAHTNLDNVETDITTCDDGFQEHGEPAVMSDHDKELQKLASNLLSIGAAIKQ